MHIPCWEQHERDVSVLHAVTMLGLNGTAIESRLIRDAAADMTNAYVGLMAAVFASAPGISYELTDDKPAEQVLHVPRHHVTQRPDFMLEKAAGIDGDLSL